MQGSMRPRSDSYSAGQLEGLLADWGREDAEPDEFALIRARPPPSTGSHVPQWLMDEAEITRDGAREGIDMHDTRPVPRKGMSVRELRCVRGLLSRRVERMSAFSARVAEEEKLVAQLSPLRRRLDVVEQQALALAEQLASPGHAARMAAAEAALQPSVLQLATEEAARTAAELAAQTAEEALQQARHLRESLPRPGAAAAARAAVQEAEAAVKLLSQRELDEVRAMLPAPPLAVRRALGILWAMLHPQEASAAASSGQPLTEWKEVLRMLRRRDELLVLLGGGRYDVGIGLDPTVEDILLTEAGQHPQPVGAVSPVRLVAEKKKGGDSPSKPLRTMSALSLRQLATAQGLPCQGTRQEVIERLEVANQAPPPLSLEQVTRASRPVGALYSWATAQLRLSRITRGNKGVIEEDEERGRKLRKAEEEEEAAQGLYESARGELEDADRRVTAAREEVASLRAAVAELRSKLLPTSGKERPKSRPSSAAARAGAAVTQFSGGSWPLIGSPTLGV
eukprot:Hpha_TRINITY_DN16393_c3_g7::TRINITY_DN16393_c3_g7_i1::g.60142::m.60142